MFEIDKLMRILSIFMGIGPLVVAVSGFVEIRKQFILSNLVL